MSRSRSHPWRAGLVAIAALGALTGLTLLPGGAPALTPVAQPTKRLPTSPYAAKACPERISYRDVVDTLPDLTGAVAMRLCADDTGQLRQLQHPPTAAELAAREASAPPLEALVTGLDDIRAALSMSPPLDNMHCATIDVFAPPGGVTITFEDGRQVVVQSTICQPLSVRGTGTISGGDLTDQFLDALAHQRSTWRYARTVAAPLDCNASAEAPVVPAYEKVVAAAACSRYDETTGRRTTSPLASTALEDLQRAWTAARPHTHWPRSSEDECVEGDDEIPDLVVRTAHGDTVHLAGTSCGWLHLRGWRAGQSWEVPIALDDLID